MQKILVIIFSKYMCEKLITFYYKLENNLKCSFLYVKNIKLMVSIYYLPDYPIFCIVTEKNKSVNLFLAN